MLQLKKKGGDDEDDYAGSEHESNESEDDDYMEELPDQIIRDKGKKQRSSVSAEAFGMYNKKEDFKPPKFEKSAQVKEALKKRLEQAFMFSALNPDELNIVLDAMQEVKKKAGEVIIHEGEDGDNLFVVESGTLDCTKVFVSSTQILKPYIERTFSTYSFKNLLARGRVWRIGLIV